MFRRRRGRKSKIDKMLEAAAIEAMVRGGGGGGGGGQDIASSTANHYQAFGEH